MNGDAEKYKCEYSSIVRYDYDESYTEWHTVDLRKIAKERLEELEQLK